MHHTLERDVRFLKRYAMLSTLVIGVLTVGAFRQGQEGQRSRFQEIDVERINVVEPDGKLRMILSNRPRSSGPIYKGNPFGYAGGTRPGIIFFNDEGTENGGLTFTGQRDSTGRYRSSLHLSFDQFNQDQVLNLDYADNNGVRRVGMSVEDRWDVDIYDWVMERDSIMLIRDTVARAAALRRLRAPRNGVAPVVRRVFVGRDQAKSALLNLHDRDGRPRLRLIVDSLGLARVEFLDADGKVTHTLPDRSR